MAATATLVYADPNKLRYLFAYDGTSGTGTSVLITTTGAATPDILTDSLQGPIKELAKAFTDGFAGFAAGAMTTAKARAMWCSDWAGADPASGDPSGANSLVTTAFLKIGADVLNGSDLAAGVDANVDGSGHPRIEIDALLTTAAMSFYVDIEVPQAIG